MSLDRNTPAPRFAEIFAQSLGSYSIHMHLSKGLTGRSGEYPVSPMDLNGNCCLHRAVGFSPGMDHLVHTAFSFILLCLSSFFLPSCLLYFFFFLFLLSHPCQKLFVSVGIIHACVHHPHQHTSSSWCEHASTARYIFFFNMASKTLAWTVNHWNKSQNRWWWSWTTPNNKDGEMPEFPQYGHSMHVPLSIWNGFPHGSSSPVLAVRFWIQLTWDLR